MGLMKNDIWAGRDDFDHKYLRRKLDSLRASGTFITPWTHTPPHMRLTHSVLGMGGNDHGRRTTEVIQKLPVWAQEFMNVSLPVSD